jgi:hypothetical protein
MRRHVTVAFVVVVALLLLAVVPVQAHANYVAVDSQISAGGTVTVEAATVLVNAYVVVHGTNATGGIGPVIGYDSISRYSGFRQEFSIVLDNDTWAQWGDNRTVWVAIHRDEGASGFDPTEDPIQVGFGGRVAENVTVAKGEHPAYVLNERLDIPYTLGTNTVDIREVAVGEPGLVVVRANNASGPVLGTEPIEAGTTRNVTVGLDDGVFDALDRNMDLYAGLVVGGQTLSTATPLRVGGDRVGTTFPVERVGQLNATATPAPEAIPTSVDDTPTLTPVPRTTEPLVVTPTPAAETGSATPTVSPSPTPVATRTTTEQTAPTSESGPGFGPLATAVAVVFSVALSRRWLAGE